MKRLITIAALPMILSACGPTAEERFERAEAAYEANAFNEARLDLASALSERPTDPAILELYARTLLELGDGEGAAAILSRLAETGTKPADLPEMFAEAEFLAGRYDRAIALAGPLGSAEASRIAALAYVGKGDFDAARKSFAAGEGKGGAKVRYLSDYALFEMRSENLQQARKLADQASAAGPDALDPMIADGRIALREGDARRALAAFDRAVAAYPESLAALIGKIGVLGDLGRIAEAEPLIAEAASRSPDSPDVAYLRARLAVEQEDWNKARDILQQFEDTQSLDHALLYSRVLMEHGLAEQARTKLAAILRDRPDIIPARRLLGRAQMEQREYAAAYETLLPLSQRGDARPEDLTLFAQAAQKAGKSGAAVSAIPPTERLARELAAGDLAIKQGKWRAAITAYENIRQLTGDDNALVLNNLAYAHSQSGNKTAALELAEKALKLSPDNPSVMDTAGWLLFETGNDKPRGLRLLEQAAKLAPGNPTIAKHLKAAKGA